MLTKDEIRKSVRETRKSLTAAEVREKSEAIKKKLFLMPEFRDAKTVCFYVSFRNEVDTHEMLVEAKHLDKKVALPYTNPETNRLELYEMTIFDELKENALGILEPVPQKENLILEETVDLFIVPGVAFDKYNHRVGYGKGFYDKLLVRARKGAETIGLAFGCQMVDEIPVGDHDVPLSRILTD